MCALKGHTGKGRINEERSEYGCREERQEWNVFRQGCDALNSQYAAICLRCQGWHLTLTNTQGLSLTLSLPPTHTHTHLRMQAHSNKQTHTQNQGQTQVSLHTVKHAHKETHSQTHLLSQNKKEGDREGEQWEVILINHKFRSLSLRLII